jgi:hypothetical protein
LKYAHQEAAGIVGEDNEAVGEVDVAGDTHEPRDGRAEDMLVDKAE